MAANQQQAPPAWSDRSRGGVCFKNAFKFFWPPFTAQNDDDMVVKQRDLLSMSTLEETYGDGLLPANFTALDDLGKVKALRSCIQF